MLDYERCCEAPSVYLYDERSTEAPRRYTDEIFRVLVMSSNGFASSTMKSALLFGSIVPVLLILVAARSVARGRDDHLRRSHPGSHHVRHFEVRRIRRVPIGAYDDAHAGGIHLCQVARLDFPECLLVGSIRVALLKRLEIRGAEGPPQPFDIRRHPAIGHVRPEDQVWMLFDECHVLIIEVLVTHTVRERVDAGAQRRLCIFEGVDVSDDAEPILVRFI